MMADVMAAPLKRDAGSVRDWRFAPGSQNGKPAAMAIEIPVTFRLTNG